MFKILPLFLLLLAPALGFATSIGDFKGYKFGGVYNLSNLPDQDKFCETKELIIEVGTNTASISLDGLKFGFTDEIFSDEGELSTAVNAKGEKIKVRLKIKSVTPQVLEGSFKLLVIARQFSMTLLPKNQMEMKIQDEVLKTHRCQFTKTREF